MNKRLDNLKPFKPVSEKALCSRPFCVKLPSKLDEVVRSLPETAVWVRKVIEDAARAQGIYKGEEE